MNVNRTKERLMSPVLSIVIPVLNRQMQLAELLKDLVADAVGYNVEIIVVDDGSDPQIRVDQNEVRLLRLSKTSGANVARAEGFAQSRGLYVHFHDSDDTILPGWTCAIFQVINYTPDADIIVTRRKVRSSGEETDQHQAFFEAACRWPHRIAAALLFRNVLGPFGGVVFSRQILTRTNFPNIASSQDWAVYIEVYRHCPKATCAPDAIFISNIDGSDRVSASARDKVRGMFGLLRLNSKSRLKQVLRIHHLDYFRLWGEALARPSLTRIFHKTTIRRLFIRGLVEIYLLFVLGRR